MSEDLKVHDMVCHWIDVLGLKGWTIATEGISKEAVAYADDVPIEDRYFVGVQVNKKKMQAMIYHDRSLSDEYVIHELLHVKYPDWSEEQVNFQTTLYLAETK